MSYSISAVDKAGRQIRKQAARHEDVALTRQWRGAHLHALNSLLSTIQPIAAQYAENDIVVMGRLKRYASIKNKLQRVKPSMRLTQMLDIAGARIICLDKYLDTIKTDCEKAGLELTHDYVAQPKPTGYRGLHLKGEFNGEWNDSPRKFLSELQLRTWTHHAWATTVEMYDILRQETLKTTDNDSPFHQFFKECSYILAGQSTPERISGIQEIEQEHHIFSDLLQGFDSVWIPQSENETIDRAGFYLVAIDGESQNVEIDFYEEIDARSFVDIYAEAEEQKPDINYVLAYASSMDALRRSLPNYFFSSRENEFTATIGKLLGSV